MESRPKTSAENEYLMVHSKILAPTVKRADLKNRKKNKDWVYLILGSIFQHFVW